jgi:hypothetical protein
MNSSASSGSSSTLGCLGALGCTVSSLKSSTQAAAEIYLRQSAFSRFNKRSPFRLILRRLYCGGFQDCYLPRCAVCRCSRPCSCYTKLTVFSIRCLQFFKHMFSVDNILAPLPTPLRKSLSHNFGFFTRVFTQFVGKGASCADPA